MSVPGFSWQREDFASELKKSSFAPAALLLDAAARRDLEVYYAFCRAVDDSADDFGAAEGRRYLRAWKQALAKAPKPGAPLLVRELWRVAAERGIPVALYRALIDGALSDLRPKVRFATARALDRYCYQVAGSVGLCCLPLFGIAIGEGRAYAETLGRAFQLINIVRDAKEDAARGRIYFAQDDLKRLGPERVLRAYAERARLELEAADRLAAALPKRGLRPSRLMRRLYGALLDEILADGLRVYEKRYRLGKLRKTWIVLTGLLS